MPPLTGRVVDQTGTLSGGDIASLQQTLGAFESRKGSQIAVLIVPTTAPESIEQYSLRVAEAWKIGRRKIDDGALLVVAKDDRRLRIEVGYGLEGALNDVTARRIIDEDITPRFKSGDFAGGIAAGVDRMIRVIDGEKLPAPEPAHWQSPGLSEYINPLNPFVLMAVFIVGAHAAERAGPAVGFGRHRRHRRVPGVAFRGLGHSFGDRGRHRLRHRDVRRLHHAVRRTRPRRKLVRRLLFPAAVRAVRVQVAAAAAVSAAAARREAGRIWNWQAWASSASADI